MKYRIPAYYFDFQCIGNQCEDTCCAGWKIEIDKESLKRYYQETGEFGERLRQNINKRERSFCLDGRRCAFLNADNLCDIYKELGKEALCETCRTYPRHTEDYGEVREKMLSLTCPEAARMILGDESHHIWKMTEKEIKRSDEERKQDPDPEVFAMIQAIRSHVVAMVQNRSLSIQERIAMVLAYIHDVQCSFQMDQDRSELQNNRKQRVNRISERYLKPYASERFHKKLESFKGKEKERWIRVCAWMRLIQSLDPVLEQWERKQGIICRNLYHRHSYESYQTLLQRFDHDAEVLEQEWENLFLYFIHTYLPGACYDEDLYSKVKLAVFSYVVIREWCLFCYGKTGEINRDLLVAASYRFAREVENSDANLEQLEMSLREDEQFYLKHMITVLMGADE